MYKSHFHSFLAEYNSANLIGKSIHLTIGDRRQIISLRLDPDVSGNQIARMVNCSNQCVLNILILYHETDNTIQTQERSHANALDNNQICI